ncbi:GNAT family N-acetyltransferase [Pedobacter sp. PLR]|uniref:GNAT family N-acetyltransferase n=1 Tax=Pedobacter sp. PLR TaxID=2994465 RepID=UPI002247AF74|nr:GNAT family N-acetyltransferase [Pedobacter sp. PLR]MCX2449920.1 GNAT family N-acetyltransferase [Pedobacter sp. PLR]
MSYIENDLPVPMYHIVTDQDAEKWFSYVKKSVDYDIYHTLHYHTLDKRGEPILFVYEEGEAFIALPLLRRAIENTSYYDFTSSYGYAGPISNKKFETLSNSLIANFKYSFVDFMQKNQAISVFSRLNPFINQRFLLEKLGGIRSNGKTIYIDLMQSIEEQRSKYDKRLGRQIRQLQKKGFLVKEADTQEEIGRFTNMYNKNMQRLEADQSYFFTEEYFTSLLKNSEFNCKLILIYDGDEMICGATVIWSDDVIRNHLSATSESHIHFSPSKLMMDEISLIGRTLGMKFFHLGGGVGGKQDTLFNFKALFSDLLLEDNIWCFVADESTYNKLVEQKSISIHKDYFPLYRNV